MTEGLADRLLEEHLRNCPECAAVAAADRQLTETFHRERVVDEQMTPFTFFKARVETLAAQRKEQSIMSSVFNQLTTHRGWSIGLVAAMVLFFFVTLVPFSYEKTTGFTASVTIPNPQNEPSPKMVKDALAALGYSDVSINANVNDQEVTFTMGKFDSEVAAHEAAAALSHLTGSVGTVAITPVIEKVSGSLYAQVRDKFVTIEIHAEGKSDAEVAAEVAAKLAAAGLPGANVSVTTDADGTRQIDIDASDDSAQRQMQLKLQGSGSAELMIAADSTLTDAELKATIEQRLRDRGVANPNVTVTSDGQGHREIRVEAQK